MSGDREVNPHACSSLGHGAIEPSEQVSERPSHWRLFAVVPDTTQRLTARDVPSYSNFSGNPAASHAARNFACLSMTFLDGSVLGAMLASEPHFPTFRL